MPDPFVLTAEALADARAGQALALGADARHHLRTVLRLADGAGVVVTDGRGATAAARVRGDRLVLDEDPAAEPATRPRIRVLQGLAKGRKHDEVVRMLTELGVERVSAVTAARSQVQLDGDRAERARRRWQAVAVAAGQQARRAWMPTVDGPLTLAEALADLDGARLLVAHLGAELDPLAAIAGRDDEEVVVAVGPEGGWTADEVATMRAAGAVVVSLGRTVLRTEHAATVLAAVVAAGTGRMAVAATPWE